MKTVFITGASSGIGKEAAKLFAARGWNVIAAMRNPEKEKELDGVDAVLKVRCDVREQESVKKAFALATETFGDIDVLVNNAGVYTIKPLESMTAAEIDDVLDTNVKGVITCTQAVLPYFRKKVSGTVINVSSVAGFATFPFQTVYHASKWGLEGLSESLHYELNALNVKVKIVEPGVVKTSLYDRLNGDDAGIHEEYRENFKKSHGFLLKNIQKGCPPTVTAETIYRAATDGACKLRYRSGCDTGLAAFLRSALPVCVFMCLVEKMAGLRRVRHAPPLA